MSPHSFLAEWCFQSLTERMTLTRLQLWHRFQSATDLELAEALLHSNCSYDLDEVVSAISEIRTANAGDLGEFALFALGLGNVPLRPSELDAQRRDILIQLEVVAIRAHESHTTLRELADSIRPLPVASLSDLSDKYSVPLSHVIKLSKKPCQVHDQEPGVSRLPELVKQTRQEKTGSGQRMVQFTRLLSIM